MKKLLVLGISLAMMASLSAVAFAAEDVDNDKVLGPGETKGDTVVKTTYDEPTDPDVPTEDETWTVTIPATMDIAWDNENDSTCTANYSVKATLLPKSSVTVTVAEWGQEINLLSTEGKTLPAKVTGEKDIEQFGSGEMVGHVDTTITAEDFSNASVGTYRGQINFTVQYENELGGNSPIA